MNPLLKKIVEQYLNPDRISDYVIQIVNNALNPEYEKDWEKVTAVLILCKQKDPEFTSKLRAVLKILNNILDEIDKVM